MCGIFGYCLYRDPPKKDDFYKAVYECFVDIEARGTDASGSAWMSGDRLWYWKEAIRSSLTKDAKWWDGLKDANSRIAVFHTRATTSGTEKQNINNHPHTSEYGALVHNGILWGETTTAKEEGVTLKSECDSELILRLVDKTLAAEKPLLEAGEYALKTARGSIAAAFLSKKHKQLMLLSGEGSPLHITIIPRLGVFFSSLQNNVEDRFVNSIRCRGPIPEIFKYSGGVGEVFVFSPKNVPPEYSVVEIARRQNNNINHHRGQWATSQWSPPFQGSRIDNTWVKCKSCFMFFETTAPLTEQTCGDCKEGFSAFGHGRL